MVSFHQNLTDMMYQNLTLQPVAILHIKIYRKIGLMLDNATHTLLLQRTQQILHTSFL